MRVEADTLQEAFSKAAAELSCSVTKLDIQVIQHPRLGIFGLFKKSAIIEAFREGEPRKEREAPVAKKEEVRETVEAREAPRVSDSKEYEERKPRQKKSRSRRKKEPFGEEEIALSVPEEPFVKQETPFLKTNEEKEEIYPYQPKQRNHAVVGEVIKALDVGVRELVQSSCFAIEVVRVEAHDEQTVLIEINGEDAALLIGKEGYRYKAFSYLLYNWINMKYGLGIRLEIAQFLHNQEEMIENYLAPVVERIESQGRGQTKPLDGVLIKIALEKLRARFPEKYVGIKTGREGRKFVVVNDFNRKSI
ncbi:MAG: Jag N-terminal domain-containing protein [Campylobacterales bacterium]|nr:Jag N-terminal domain-containing protein [Campylobacterales bacterium]